jgi:spermidine synthase
VVLNGSRHFFDVRFVKGLRQPETLAMRWNSFSRVDVAGTPKSLWTPRAPAFAGFSGRLDPDFEIPEVKITYDADASSQITYFDGDLRRMEYLSYDVSSTVYHLRRFQNVLVIGPGGGRDILTGLSLGSKPITGVEINPLTVELMRSRFRTFSGGLYAGLPGVTVVNDEGRSFLRHQSSQYDLIEASLIDTWAASAAGAYALTENNLYTVDAFEDDFAHLTPDGVLCFNRWFSEPPVEVLRLMGLAREALARRGVGNPEDHVMIVRTDPSDTLTQSLASILVKASPFSPVEVNTLAHYASQMGFLLSHVPPNASAGIGELSPEQRIFDSVLGLDSAEFTANYPFDITPVSDDRPFFFNRVPIVPWLLVHAGLSRSPVGRTPLSLGGQTLLVSLVATAVATLVLLVVPYWFDRRQRRSRSAETSTNAGVIDPRRNTLWVAYFAGLGLGFILVEIVLIQRFSLFLGYPVYSLSVVLFTLLITTGLGSLVSARFEQATVRRALGALSLLLLAFALALPAVLSAARGVPIALRISIAILAICPLGLLMGVPFASGIRWAGAESKALVPWAWAVNGGASVFGSTLAVVTSMTYGFTATGVVAAITYGLACAALAQLARMKTGDAGAGQAGGARAEALS